MRSSSPARGSPKSNPPSSASNSSLSSPAISQKTMNPNNGSVRRVLYTIETTWCKEKMTRYANIQKALRRVPNRSSKRGMMASGGSLLLKGGGRRLSLVAVVSDPGR
jgi:hypothetical protein